LLGDYDKAMQIYEEVKKSEPANVSLQMAMLDYYKMNGQDSLYVAVRDSILYSPETESGKKTLLLQNMVQTSPKYSVADQEIIQRFEHILGSDSTNVEILTLYALFLEYREKSTQYIASLMHSILNIQPENEMALQWLTTYYVSNADILSMEEMCRRAINYYPSNLTYYYFLSYALMNTKNYEGILELLERGLRLCSEETKPQLISEVFTQRGDAYYALGEYDKAFLEYDSALVYNKDNILCLNNYAYFLSLRNEQLDRAEEMSYRTVKLEPNNPTYLDTYAWILFMQQDYIGAQSYMDRVVPRDSTEQFLLSNEELSGVLLEHAGDIAWMNGETERAVQLWRLALQKKDDDVTPKLRKKAKKKKYYK
jgi:tetratricopeptide (TPR) repeat protein